MLWARACGRGGPAMSLWRACPAGGCIPWDWWEAVPGGLPPNVWEASAVEEAAVYAFGAHNLSNQGKDRSKLQLVSRKPRKEPRRVGSPPPTFKQYITKYPKGCFAYYGRNQAHDNDHKTCKRYAEDKAAFGRANPDRKLKSERPRPQGIREVQA